MNFFKRGATSEYGLLIAAAERLIFFVCKNLKLAHTRGKHYFFQRRAKIKRFIFQRKFFLFFAFRRSNELDFFHGSRVIERTRLHFHHARGNNDFFKLFSFFENAFGNRRHAVGNSVRAVRVALYRCGYKIKHRPGNGVVFENHAVHGIEHGIGHAFRMNDIHRLQRAAILKRHGFDFVDPIRNVDHHEIRATRKHRRFDSGYGFPFIRFGDRKLFQIFDAGGGFRYVIRVRLFLILVFENFNPLRGKSPIVEILPISSRKALTFLIRQLNRAVEPTGKRLVGIVRFRHRQNVRLFILHGRAFKNVVAEFAHVKIRMIFVRIPFSIQRKIAFLGKFGKHSVF